MSSRLLRDGTADQHAQSQGVMIYRSFLPQSIGLLPLSPQSCLSAWGK
ncbi:hypothetical protein [Gluconacetobacter liquefaciens]|uniref:Uncharacterized protein n=1 Tax=Gluconacetobacter liquefaciens TaxID=89584 RepID=A0A370GA77_GLULI|nr:hypothetical protein [Gluconacetobacter liquefaciens]MBB2185303.1 hypothetical protein [Gluconacetobacter liquefaciens]RDI40742.1 hypothetical protein C7453_101541 [Gluconacetobacter liquefaciens]